PGRNQLAQSLSQQFMAEACRTKCRKDAELRDMAGFRSHVACQAHSTDTPAIAIDGEHRCVRRKPAASREANDVGKELPSSRNIAVLIVYLAVYMTAIR